MADGNAQLLRVSTTSSPSSTAGAIAAVLGQGDNVELTVIGASALNQAIKAMAIARSYLRPSGCDLTFVPSFTDVEIDGQIRTALRLLVERRNR